MMKISSMYLTKILGCILFVYTNLSSKAPICVMAVLGTYPHSHRDIVDLYIVVEIKLEVVFGQQLS